MPSKQVKAMGLISFFTNKFSRKRPIKLGLALGSGGAKGLAHIGALKAFEEEGITFSFVTGTSIGGIVGALYAKGYTSADMTGIIESLNRKEFARNLRPFGDMAFAEEYLKEYVEGDFSSLRLPFAVWATDGETNDGVLLREGSVPRALTASAAIPPFFRSVEIGGKRLYDGAFTNAIPADICKEMGAEAVVAIDLSAYMRPEEEKGMLSRLLGTAVGAFVPVKTLENAKSRGYDAADIMLRPNLYDFKATDVSREAMDKMYEIGYAEARAHMDEIKALAAQTVKK